MSNENRTKFIGSSDIAAIMGMSRRDTPLSVWAQKTGRVEKDLSANEAVEWGNRLEEPVAQKFAEEHGVKLMAYKKRFKHDKYDFLSCELDRLITGTDEIVECKTCSAWKANEWDEDEIPAEYILQVMFALGITGRKKGWIAVLIGGNKYKEREIEFDPEMYLQMIDTAVNFWNEYVLEDEPPVAMVGDEDVLAELYPEEEREELDIIDAEDAEKYNELAKKREIYKKYVKEHKEGAKEYENKLKQAIGDGVGFRTDRYKVTWKKQSRKYINRNKMREDGIYDKYAEERSNRVFRIHEFKEKDNG